MTAYRPPRDCPVCRHRLDVTQLGCPECGTGLSGRFEPCEFCALEAADRDLLRVFLRARGNMKELERHLGVSYPTARARFDELLARLGLGGATDAPGPPGAEADRGRRGETSSAAGGPPGGAARRPSPPDGDPRLATLEALARGEVSVDEARRALADDLP